MIDKFLPIPDAESLLFKFYRMVLKLAYVVCGEGEEEGTREWEGPGGEEGG
jgi:hypothetical protein